MNASASKKLLTERANLLADAIDDLETREKELTFHPDDVHFERAAPLIADIRTAMRACVRVLEIDVAALAGLGVEHQNGARTIRVHNYDDDPVIL